MRLEGILLARGTEADMRAHQDQRRAVGLLPSLLESSLDAIQIFGGYGYMTEQEIERDLRDAVGGTIYSGTNEIQRNIVAASLGL